MRGKVEVAANNFFLFSFSNLDDCSRTLSDGHWFWGRIAFALKSGPLVLIV